MKHNRRSPRLRRGPKRAGGQGMNLHTPISIIPDDDHSVNVWNLKFARGQSVGRILESLENIGIGCQKCGRAKAMRRVFACRGDIESILDHLTLAGIELDPAPLAVRGGTV